ncbi:MAG TPA: DUF3300 domain-containing protein [Verrucomicrobiae bacterium]|nr:DUF3300 domain-containing protein [Verrucomicrobiae bacterium]
MRTFLRVARESSVSALALSSVLLMSLTAGGQAQPQNPPGVAAGAPAQEQGSPLLAAEELDKLVAPIALYPDPLLAQVLPASTYPLEVVQASRWMQKHGGLQGKELEAAVAGEEWAESVKALCPFPDVLGYMDEHLDWTTQLGDAVLNQEQDVLDAIQRMRLLAQNAGTLQSNDKQIVEVEDAGDRQVVVIKPYQPEVIYVPVYDPAVVYYRPRHYVHDDWAYGLFRFGAGVLAGALFWDWDCDWHHRAIVYDRDYYRRRHHRIDWDDHDWDRYDWRRGDRIHQRGIDIDITHIDIDNIDINRCDWRHTDLRRFDWNRVDWHKVNYDRLGFGKRDWKDVDWAAAGISNPQLIESLKNLPPGEREQFRQRFEKAHRNQEYKDKISKLQKERLKSGDKAPEIQASRWEHSPDHRRGVAYKGPAKEHFEKLISEGPREGISGRTDGGKLRRGADGTKSMSDLGEGFKDSDRKRGGKDAGLHKGEGMGDLRRSDRATSVLEGKGKFDGDHKTGDKDKSSGILKGLRDRESGGDKGVSSNKGQSENNVVKSQQATTESFRKNKGDDYSRKSGGDQGSGGGEQQFKKNKGQGGGGGQFKSNKGQGGGGNQQVKKGNKGQGGGDKDKGNDRNKVQKKY